MLYALTILLAASNGDGGRGGGDIRAPEYAPDGDDVQRIIGRWAGDEIAIVGDYAEPNDVPDSDADINSPWSNPGEWNNVGELVAPIMRVSDGITFSGDGWKAKHNDG